MVDAQSTDHIVASAAQFLIGGGDNVAADVLLSCSLELRSVNGCDSWYEEHSEATLSGPRRAYDILTDEDNEDCRAIRRAIQAIVGREPVEFFVRAELVPLDPGWRAELQEIARGGGVHNQGVEFPGAEIRPPLVWANLRFRSQSEVRIAQELDRRGVMYLPNCLARLNVDGRRGNREPDFLICHDGKWGVLEVDGAPFHPAARAAQEYERDRLFKSHGIRVVERFDASRCYQSPEAVVTTFLNLLARP